MAGLFVPNMTPEQIANARKWIAALRSGKYEQGFGALCIPEFNRPKRWCCLGVGSDVVGHEPGTRGSLLQSETVALGLRTGMGYHDSPGMSLAALNDQFHKTFPEIADVIEAELALVTEVTA